MLMWICVSITFFGSCKKQNNKVQTPACNIITVVATGGGTENFTYTAEGKISTISIGNSITVFTYSANTIVAIQKTSGVFDSKKTITLNSDGYATNVKAETNKSGSLWYNDQFEYNGTEVIKDTYTSSANNTSLVTTFNWSGGNMISLTNGNFVNDLAYYTDKPSQMGDYFDLSYLFQGYRVYHTKNAVKSFSSNGSTTITDIGYTYDATGRINAVTITGASAVVKYDYEYQCN